MQNNEYEQRPHQSRQQNHGSNHNHNHNHSKNEAPQIANLLFQPSSKKYKHMTDGKNNVYG